MTIKQIYGKVKELKQIIINIVQEVSEPSSWEELKSSLEDEHTGYYRIIEGDLPVIRDLKAFLNMLNAIEKMAEKMTTHYGLIGASLGYKILIMQDMSYFYDNYKVYRSTNSIITKYLSYLKDISLSIVLPQIISKMQELGRLCTLENMDKVSEFIIEQVISLEQYQYNYLQKKQSKSLPSDLVQEKKSDLQDDNITTMIKKIDQNLRSIYKQKYDIHFIPEGKAEDKKNQIIDYYPDNKKDTDIIKNIKLLSNAIIGIKKVLDDHEAYQQSSIYGGVTYFPSFVKNLHRVYSSLSEFDYQAMIAEKSTPFTNEIKLHLSKLNDLLEKLACIADQFELELRLKEGTLLHKVDVLIERHNQIMHELRITTNYLKQKHTYYKARLASRQTILTEIDEQIKKLKQFLIYRHDALIKLPYVINNAIQDYIGKYYDDICMDRNHLDKYKKYLVAATHVQTGIKSYFIQQIEYVGNYYGYTIHAEFMKSLVSRLLYLQKQKEFISLKNQEIIVYHKNQPFDQIPLNEMVSLNQQSTILTLLQHRANELTMENDALLEKAVLKRSAKSLSKDAKAESKDQKTISPDVKITEDDIDKSKTKIRLYNQIQLKHNEQKFFSNLAKSFASNPCMPEIDAIQKDATLSSKSLMLLHELSEFNKLADKKLAPS